MYLNNNHLVKFLNRKDGKDTKFLVHVCLADMSLLCPAQPVQPKLTHPAGSWCVWCQVPSTSLTCLPAAQCV